MSELEPEDPHVKVSLISIYAKLLELETILRPLPKDVDDHEARIRALEKRVWTFSGIASVAGAVLSQIVGKVLGGS